MSRSMRITSVMLVLTLCLLTVACENLSQENYNKIKVGMSLQEVEKLLGSSHLRLGGGHEKLHLKVKVIKLKFLALLIAAGALFCLYSPAVFGQTTSADISKKAGETWNAIKAYGADKQKEAVAHGKALMKEADAKIAELEDKSAKASGDAKAQYEKQIKNLKASRDNASAKLTEMEKSSASAWDATKNGFADAYKDLHQAYGKAVEQFK